MESMSANGMDCSVMEGNNADNGLAYHIWETLKSREKKKEKKERENEKARDLPMWSYFCPMLMKVLIFINSVSKSKKMGSS